MQDQIIIRTVVRLLVPFIFMFGLYVQFHGDYSPGGGFQAGVICATAFIAHGLINGLDSVSKIISLGKIRIMTSIGVLIYGGTGVVSMLMGGKYLDYSVLADEAVHGQEVGIILIELGVGITVFSVMMLIFFMFAKR